MEVRADGRGFYRVVLVHEGEDWWSKFGTRERNSITLQRSMLYLLWEKVKGNERWENSWREKYFVKGDSYGTVEE